MKLRFQRHGRQFFFFTFCVEGRRPVLARLVKGRGLCPRAPEVLTAGGSGGAAPRPLHGGGNDVAHTELLPAGESVIAFLKSLHRRNPALTASDRVVMPDHVHFVLIVDFDRDPGFQPLSFAHQFMEGIATEGGLGGHRPPSFGSSERLWEPNFWIVLSFSPRQLSAIRKYIHHNPARALWKAEHPDRFIRYAGFHHPILDSALRWSACGDLTLLGSPFLFPVRLTRRRSVEAQEGKIAEAVERALCGMIPVCGFLSPAEKELQRRLRANARARWIKMVPHGLPLRYDPSVEDSRAFAEGRLLVLSSFPPEIPFAPISRESCDLMNARILRLCGPAAEPINTSALVGTTPAQGARGATPQSFGEKNDEP